MELLNINYKYFFVYIDFNIALIIISNNNEKKVLQIRFK